MIGTVIWLSVFSVVSSMFEPVVLSQATTHFGIAVCHSAFNVLCTLLLLPASSLLERLAYRLVPEGKTADLLANLERVSDHCSNVAIGIIDASDNNMNSHEALKGIKEDNSAFNEKSKKYFEKYSV